MTIKSQCMEQTWYLSVDMQLFIIAPIFVYILWRWPLHGILTLVVFTLASIGANFAIFAVYDLPPTIMFTRLNDLIAVGTDSNKYYNKPWTRAPPYMLGLLTGWHLHALKDSTNKPLPNVKSVDLTLRI